MKFSDGNWLTQPGISIHAAAEIHEVVNHGDALTLYAPTKHIANRGATLDGPLLTLLFSSPMPDVIRVQAYHYKGQNKKGPEFQLQQTSCPVTTAENDEMVSLTSGNLTVRISKKSGNVEYLRGQTHLTGSGRKGLAYVKAAPAQSYMREQLGISVGENIYGLGERFTPFVKNGQIIDIWNKDGGTNSEQSYKNIPFYVSNKGYGVFVNHPELVSFEVASEVVSRVQFSVAGEYLEYFILDGPTPKDVLEKYTQLTGKPALPPAWSFGLWLTTSFTTDYDEATVNHFVDGMAERDIPLRVFHFDTFWMKEFEWCNFEWDTRVFPDPQGMLRRLKDKGLNVCVWINPYIAQKSSLFDEAASKGYLLKRPNGDVWQWDLWQAGMGIVDFTNPEAGKWFAEKLKHLLDMGVDTFKTDFGERIPTDVVYYDGSDPQKMHNYYTYLYNQVVFDLLKETRGDNQAVLFARSATAGSQQFPVHWGGDCSATYESMAESLRGGLSLSMSGFGFWSHDIGGFEDASTPDLYKRWIAFGLLSSHSRLHGNSSYRVPWIYDEESVAVLRHFTNLKYTLMPYLFQTAVEASTRGIPVMRPMVLEFPQDPACDYLDRQYMLGESLLVAPVFGEDGMVSYYLPHGTWTHFLSGEIVQGGGWRRDVYDYLSLPLFVRQNSLLAIGGESNKPDYDYSEGVTLHLFQLAEQAELETVLYDGEGAVAARAQVTRDGELMEVRMAPAPLATADLPVSKAWSVLLRNVQAIRSLEKGTWTRHELGILVTPETPDSVIKIQL